jgi:hypothetical protein
MRRPPLSAALAVVGLLTLAGAPNARADETATPVVMVSPDAPPDAPPTGPWGSTFKNHLAIQLGFGYGTLPMGQGGSSSQAKYVAAYNSTLAGQGFALSGSAADPGGELHAALTLAYYFPYYITLRAGAEVAFFEPAENINPIAGNGQGNVATNYGGAVMIPLLLGPHLSFAHDKVVVELMVGPTFTVYTSNGLSDNQLSGNVQMNADTAIGVDSVLGIHYMASKIFGVGIEGGYRSLVTGPVHQVSGSGTYSFSGASGTVSPINLDFSGFRGVIDMMILAM